MAARPRLEGRCSFMPIQGHMLTTWLRILTLQAVLICPPLKGLSLDRRHGLQGPCFESGSDCGFVAAFRCMIDAVVSMVMWASTLGFPRGGNGEKLASWLSTPFLPRHRSQLPDPIRFFQAPNCNYPLSSSTRECISKFPSARALISRTHARGAARTPISAPMTNRKSAAHLAVVDQCQI